MTTKPCLAGMHAACKGDRASCDCPTCHLGPCVQCGTTNLMKMYGDRCAGCVRAEGHAAPKRTTPCDVCGAAGAYRNPATRRDEFMCTSCHHEVGEPLQLTMPISSLIVSCAGKDIDDPAHIWVHFRGTRFQCRCGTKRYDAKLRAARRRAEEM